LAEIGHNSGDADSTPSAIAGDQLKAFIERVERLEEDKAAVSEDIKEVYAEAKGTGFDTKIIRKIVAMRKRDHAELKEEQEMFALYCEAIGADFML
jgi:uncharacterized protein (UPF0335 family)